MFNWSLYVYIFFISIYFAGILSTRFLVFGLLDQKSFNGLLQLDIIIVATRFIIEKFVILWHLYPGSEITDSVFITIDIYGLYFMDSIECKNGQQFYKL